MRNGFTKIPNNILDLPLSMEAIYLYMWLSINADKNGQIVTSYRKIAALSGMSFQRVRTAMKMLLETQVVTQVVTQHSTQVATILTITFLSSCANTKKVANTSSNTSANTSSNTPRAYKNDLLFNHSIEEDKEEKRNNLSVDKFKEKFGKYDFSFVADDMAETFFRWLSYRKELKKPFATQSTLRQNYNKLMKLADNSPEKARLIVEQSIERQWEGLFSLLEERKENTVGQILHDNSADKYLNDEKWK